MYQDLFTNSFFSNFLTGFLFLILNIVFSYSVSHSLKRRNIFFFEEFQTIVVFYLIFFIYSIILNFLIIFNLNEFFRSTFYFLFFFQIIFLLYNFDYLKNFKLKRSKLKSLTSYIVLTLFLFYLIAILPITDADSISLHQNLANKIYQEGLTNINFDKNISFTIFSNTQNLLIISPILKSDNFGSQLNLIILIFFIFSNFKNHKNFAFILFSCPLIIYFVSTQKLQLFFGILFLLVFVIINKKQIKSKLELFLILLLLTFYSSGNISYILFASVLFLYLFIQQKKQWLTVVFYSLISFILILLPIFIIKQIYFQNILAPFLDNFLGNNNILYNAYALSIRSTAGWLEDVTNLKLYLKPFIAFNLNDLSSSLGLIFLIMLLDPKIHQRTKFFSLILIAIVLSTGQILPRYYFESFLILAYYFSFKNFLSKIIVISHNLLIVIISSGFIYFAYIDSDVINNKTKFMSKFSYTYFNNQEDKKLNINENILDFSTGRPSLFSEKNIYSSRTIRVMERYNEDYKYINKFISNNNIKYIINDGSENLPNCLSLSKIGNINRKLAVRNFLRNEQINEYDVFQINTNSC